MTGLLFESMALLLLMMMLLLWPLRLRETRTRASVAILSSRRRQTALPLVMILALMTRWTDQCMTFAEDPLCKTRDFQAAPLRTP